MADFKPILYVFLFIFIFGFILNIFVAPFVPLNEVVEGSAMAVIIDFVEDGVSLTLGGVLSLVFPDIEIVNISPVTWFWFGLDFVTDFVIEQLTLMSYIPDSILIPLIVIFLITLIYSIIALIRG